MSKKTAKVSPPSILRTLRPFIFFSIVYTLLIFILPANKMVMYDHNFTSEQYHIVLFLVLLPYMLLWFGVFYCYARLLQYTTIIDKSPEGVDFEQITRGSKWLAYGLPIPAVVAICLYSFSSSHPSSLATTLSIINYLSLAIALVAYTYMRRGAHGLAERSKTRFSINNARLVVLLLIVVGVAYCYVTFRNLELQSLGSSKNPYHLPAWIIISTIIIPYLYAWFSGLIAAYDIVLYSKQVHGVIYRQAMRLLSIGILAVIAGSIGLQYLRNIVPSTANLELNRTLLVANILYVIMAVGFTLIIVGINRLRKIEEV